MKFFYHNGFMLDPAEQQQMKLIRALTGFALEDFGQNLIQYFYKEKYLLEDNIFVYVKALITLLTTLLTFFKLGEVPTFKTRKKFTKKVKSDFYSSIPQTK